MTRQEFRAEIQELVIAARPDVDISLHDIRYHLEKLEEILFGLRGADDQPPDVFSEYLGRIS
jgi:hypothetical protein